MADQITLAINVAQVEAIEAALEKAQRDLVSEVNNLRDEVETRLAAWGDVTQSRQAQKTFDRKLEQSVRELGEALAVVRQAVAATRMQAHRAEVRNVAIVMS